MSRLNLREVARITAAGALFLALAIPAAAAPPSGSGTSSDPPSPLDGRLGVPPEFQSLGISKPVSVFEGTVLDINDRPVPNVLVQLFDNGELLASTTTDGSGIYDLRAVYNLNDDTTSLLWFVTPDRAFMPKELVLRESRASVENHLISRCVPRTSYAPGRQFRVYLFDPANRNKELAELDCLP
ncbi:MAG TPA: carboxypeptidase-like regulatory domain-containing protein [Candidatus Eisenbacteria bacterium]